MISLLQSPPAGEPPYILLATFLGLTVLLIVADLVTALQGRRRLHVSLALVTMVCFAIAILFAEEVGTYWTFEPLYLQVHLVCAYAGTALAILTLLSGARVFFLKGGLVWHKRIAFLFVGFVLLATGTALLMFQHGERL